MAASFVELLVGALEAKERAGLEAAIELLAQAVALAPPDHYCQLMLAAWLREAGRTAEARALLERLMQAAPSLEARLQLAHLLRDAGEFSGALEHGRAVLAEAPGNEAAQTLTRQLEAAIQAGAGRLDYLLGLLGPLMLEHRYPAPFVEFTGRPHGWHADGNVPNGDLLDAWGFPNAAPPSARKPDDEIRIFVLGDSTMSLGPKLSSTVPALLESALRNGGLPTARVYNFGVVSASAMQMVMLLLHRLVDYQPDLVIACNGGIDLVNARENDPRPSHPFHFFMIEELHAHAFDPSRGGPIRSRDEFLWRSAAHQLTLRAQVGWGSPAWEERGVAAYLESVDRLGKLASGCELDIALLLEPMAAARRRPTQAEIDLLKPQTFDYYRRQYQRLRARLFAPERPRASARLTVHDADDAFDGEPGAVFEDWMHYNAAGRRLMVAYMADIVRARLAGRAAERPACGARPLAAPPAELPAGVRDDDGAAGGLDDRVGLLAVEHCHPAPFAQFTGRPGGRLDAWGFPNAAVPSARKPADEIRIFVLGADMMFDGDDFAHTLPGLLERALRDAGMTTARVYNFGVVEASAMQMVMLLFHRLVDCQPDLVMLCNGASDFANAREHDPRPGHPFNFFLIEELYTSFFDPARAGEIGSREAFRARAAAQLRQLRAQTGWSGEAWEQRVAAAYLDSVDRLAKVAAGCDLDVALLLEPTVAARRHPTAEEVGHIEPAALDYFRRQYRRVRAALFSPEAARAGARLTRHDADDAFAGTPGTVFRDGGQLNDTGRRLMALHMAAIARGRLAARTG
jgi:hypothetical protein